MFDFLDNFAVDIDVDGYLAAVDKGVALASGAGGAVGFGCAVSEA